MPEGCRMAEGEARRRMRHVRIRHVIQKGTYLRGLRILIILTFLERTRLPSSTLLRYLRHVGHCLSAIGVLGDRLWCHDDGPETAR